MSKSKKLDFRPSEFVVYPAHGVGQIVSVETQEVAGIELELFVVAFEKDKMTLRVPTNRAVEVGMRSLSSPDIVAHAFKTLKGKAKVKRAMWSRRRRVRCPRARSSGVVGRAVSSAVSGVVCRAAEGSVGEVNAVEVLMTCPPDRRREAAAAEEPDGASAGKARHGGVLTKRRDDRSGRGDRGTQGAQERSVKSPPGLTRLCACVESAPSSARHQSARGTARAAP